MTNTNDLNERAAEAIATADFRDCWPIDVRLTLVKAAKTEGEIPVYAERLVRNALRDAERIERKLARDIEVGESKLTHAQKQARKKVGASA